MPLPLRGYIFIGLNVIRVLSIVGLILAFASNTLTMVADVKAYNTFISPSQNNGTLAEEDLLNCDYFEGSTVPNQPGGIFWAVTNRFLIIFQVLILFLSEIGWPYKLFDRFFPVLGTNFGMGAIGLFQCFISVAVLSHHVDDFSLVSAFFLIAIGCLNILVGLIFRDKGKAKRSIFGWKAEKKNNDVLPLVTERTGPRRPFVLATQFPAFGSRSPHSAGEKATLDNHAASGNGNDEKPYVGLSGGFGWGRAAEKFAAAKGNLLNRPVEALPPYGTPRSRTPGDGHSYPRVQSPPAAQQPSFFFRSNNNPV